MQSVPEVEATGGASNEPVAAAAAAASMEVTAKIDMAKLQCPRCDHPFKPPIFEFLVCFSVVCTTATPESSLLVLAFLWRIEFVQCDGGHLACSDCHGELPKDKRYACGQEGAYRRNTTLEDAVGSHKTLCPYSIYGCQIVVPYHESSSHRLECPYAPCGCPEQGCTFAGSPSMVHDHLRDAHGWPVDKIRYGEPLDLRLPESQRRRLLVAEEDGRVFLVVAVGAAAGEFHEVSLACLRANATVGPQYSCRMWAMGNAVGPAGAQSVMMKMMEVPSFVASGEYAAAPLVVHRKLLNGASAEIHLIVRVDEVLP
ncbi:hypothetical protein HU200_020868 [Digitaria exilis]|uniref:SIAH-type domain-containing protein n=1 Tax=Digitaria exilis TaxID=1010633 RepID=A0A835F0R7_9POAL|nr:hypothetical protein HU200_020868 [Digitaria exilis]